MNPRTEALTFPETLRVYKACNIGMTLDPQSIGELADAIDEAMAQFKAADVMNKRSMKALTTADKRLKNAIAVGIAGIAFQLICASAIWWLL